MQQQKPKATTSDQKRLALEQRFLRLVDGAMMMRMGSPLRMLAAGSPFHRRNDGNPLSSLPPSTQTQ